MHSHFHSIILVFIPKGDKALDTQMTALVGSNSDEGTASVFTHAAAKTYQSSTVFNMSTVPEWHVETVVKVSVGSKCSECADSVSDPYIA
jgi:hypothetical protein